MKRKADLRGCTTGSPDQTIPDADTTVDAPRAAARSHRDQRSDAGFTLVEALIAVALMSIVVVPVFSAVRASISASSRTRSAAQVETLIVNIADRVNRAGTTCGYQEIVDAALGSQVPPWDPSLAVVTEEHFAPDKTTAQPGDGAWVAGACELNTVEPLLVQRVTIELSSPDGRASREIQVVKSDV